ncbi:unclassified [Brachyspira pilosicoli]|nr:unclassified [Brachyspira pilosicoli]
MGKNGIPEQQKFNYGKHREKVSKRDFSTHRRYKKYSK